MVFFNQEQILGWFPLLRIIFILRPVASLGRLVVVGLVRQTLSYLASDFVSIVIVSVISDVSGTFPFALLVVPLSFRLVQEVIFQIGHHHFPPCLELLLDREFGLSYILFQDLVSPSY